MVLSPEYVLIAEKGRSKGKQQHSLARSRRCQSVERWPEPFNNRRFLTIGS